MKIAVVGTGSMGSVYATLLAAAGHDVWAVDVWQEHVDAIRAHGLHLEGASGKHTVRINATTDTRDVGPCDLVIIATKVMDVPAAAASALVLLGPETPVISIQNGLGGPDAAARAVGRERMLVGVVAAFGASVQAPGRAHHNGWDLVRLGELGGGSTPRLERIAAMWRDAGFRVKCFADTGQLVWEKLIGNCAVSGPCAVTGMTIGEVYHDPDAWPISAGCATEAFRVARARGISLDFDDPVAYVREYGLKIPRARPSMLLDLQAGRRSEIDAINGIIPVLAREHGLAAPYNEVVSGLVRARERALGCRD